MKKIFALIALFLVLLTSCKKQKTVADNDNFSVTIGAEKFIGTNELIYDINDITERGIPEMNFTIDYLSNFADAAIAGQDIFNSVKGDKITTYQFWLKLVPATLPHTKTLFKAAKDASKIKELYINVGGLSQEERLAVGLELKKKFKDLPLGEAEELANVLLEAALVNAKLAEEIRRLKK